MTTRDGSWDFRVWIAGGVAAAGLASPASATVPVDLAAPPLRQAYDGKSDDLLTAGLGHAGLRGLPPGFADPLKPTAGELRRRAIYTAYRGLVDTTDAGGFGRLHGPGADERIAGVEYLAAVRTPDGAGTTTVMLQIPASFDAAKPCLVVVASSGSRGVYGALPTAGAWGLRHGCAVATSDKGTGVGFFDLDSGTGYRIDGVPTTDADDPLLGFRPAASDRLRAFAAANPGRVAIKHAHSGNNPEKDWGRYVLQAAKLGLALLAREYPGTDGRPAVTRRSTTVIAAGISNGGGAVLRAVEQDDGRLIDGAVVAEPNVQPQPTEGLTISMGSRPPFKGPALALLDYATLHLLYQPAAVLAPYRADAPLEAVLPAQRPLWEQWRTQLVDAGLLAGATAEDQARDARKRLEAAGMLPEALALGSTNTQFGLWLAVGAAYASAHGRLGVDEPPCGLSFAAVDAQFLSRPLTPEERARLFADGVGVAPTAGLQVVAPLPDGRGVFASLGNVQLASCLRALATGDARVLAGMAEVQMSAALRGRPVIVMHGRRDGLVPVNHTSRAYYGRHRATGQDSLRYYEIEHGQHFDAFLPLPAFAASFVPMQPHLEEAIGLMFRHLRERTPLPPSQVVRTHPRALAGAGIEPLEARHLGELRLDPGADAIVQRGRDLRIPE
ncbi:MAG: D-(-)-3-hydroxybutyrate oligomer hydrolase [Gammaproteobacteria bacterium]|nr:D-(-)-3-hydroxybutyrate oligomer hydrolase [Gammaproteobacteria bacterium]